MFSHILVPTDATDRSRNALEIAAHMLGYRSSGEEAKITLLHVIQTVVGDDALEFQKFYDELKAQARSNMQALRANISQDIPVYQEIVLGHRVREILRFISDNAVDLTILSSHQVDPNNPVEGWGTISHKVGILAPCPVMLVK